MIYSTNTENLDLEEAREQVGILCHFLCELINRDKNKELMVPLHNNSYRNKQIVFDADAKDFKPDGFTILRLTDYNKE